MPTILERASGKPVQEIAPPLRGPAVSRDAQIKAALILGLLATDVALVTGLGLKFPAQTP